MMMGEKKSPPPSSASTHLDSPPGSSDADNIQGHGNLERGTLHGLPLALMCIGLCCANLLPALDNTIITTAIPTITDQFHSLDAVAWYGSAYFLTTCSFQLIYGKLYTFYSNKWVFLRAIIIFEAGSIICATAPNSVGLIVGRAITGLGAAGIFSGVVMIIASAVEITKRSTYIGIANCMFGVASVVGPLLGGVFTDHVSWRWCFWINLPIGGVTVACLSLMKLGSQTPRRQSTWRDFDPFGTIIFLPAVISLLIALQWGGIRYSWSNWRTILLLVLSAVLWIAFVLIERWEGDRAMLPPRIMRNCRVSFGFFFAFILGSVYFAMVYFLPIWFQAIKDVSATTAGIMTIPLLLSFIVSSLLGGIFLSYTGQYTALFLVSALLTPVGVGLMTTFAPGTGAGRWISYQIILGVGTGTGLQVPIVLPQLILPEHDVPIGSAAVMLFELLGGSMFVSVGESLFTNKLAHGLVGVASQVNVHSIMGSGVTSWKDSVPPELLDEVLIIYNASLTDMWVLLAGLSTGLIVGALGVLWGQWKGRDERATASN